MVYGWMSYPLHRALPIQWAIVAYGLFSLLMLAASLLKTRIVEARKNKSREVALAASRP